MKVINFLAAIFVIFSLSADPIINYAQIDQWCAQAKKLESEEKKLLTSYFQLVQNLAQSCIKNHHWLHTDEGKKVQQEIDEAVQQLLENKNLKPVFDNFTVLIHEETNQKQQDTDCQNPHTFYYTILEMVVEGCLVCIQ